MTAAARNISAWRSPVVWLLSALPVILIVAIVVTIRIANQGGNDSARADVRRFAQVQIEDLAPDRAAAQRALRAVVTVDPRLGTVEVSSDGSLAVNDVLLLEMLHPLDAALDRRLQLHAQDGYWNARTERWDAHAWRLRLRSVDGAWRLSGQLARDQTRADLLPAVRSDG